MIIIDDGGGGSEEASMHTCFHLRKIFHAAWLIAAHTRTRAEQTRAQFADLRIKQFFRISSTHIQFHTSISIHSEKAPLENQKAQSICVVPEMYV